MTRQLPKRLPVTRDGARSFGAISGLALGIGFMFVLGFSGLVSGAIFGAGGCVAGAMFAERWHDKRKRDD